MCDGLLVMTSLWAETCLDIRKVEYVDEKVKEVLWLIFVY